MTSRFYSPDNLKALFPFLVGHRPQWLVLGGPADAAEWVVAQETWHGIKGVGIEPNPNAVAWQVGNGWPAAWPMYEAALGESEGTAVLDVSDTLRNALVVATGHPLDVRNVEVPVITLDQLHAKHDFHDAIVWMDIEGSELAALKGGQELLRSGRVLVWDIEFMEHNQTLKASMEMMARAGYVAVADWNASAACRDRIFLRKDLFRANQALPDSYCGSWERPRDCPALTFLVDWKHLKRA